MPMQVCSKKINFSPGLKFPTVLVRKANWEDPDQTSEAAFLEGN